MINKNFLVTGGNGMIGKRLVELLEHKGANVYIADLPTDLRDRNTCKEVCEGMDYVFHLFTHRLCMLALHYVGVYHKPFLPSVRETYEIEKSIDKFAYVFIYIYIIITFFLSKKKHIYIYIYNTIYIYIYIIYI